MARSRLKLPLAVAMSLLGACAATAQPARMPASALEPPVPPFAGHPYRSALAAVGNYQSCRTHARRAAVIEITNKLRSIEAEAEAKGLGPALERLRVEYQQMLAVSDMMACAHGPSAALADARHALEAFRTWVNHQPRQR